MRSILGNANILQNLGQKDYLDTIIGAQSPSISNFFLSLDRDLIHQIEAFYDTLEIDKLDQIGTD